MSKIRKKTYQKYRKIAKNVENLEKPSKISINRQKCRTPRKTVKYVKNPVKNRQKYRKTSKKL